KSVLTTRVNPSPSNASQISSHAALASQASSMVRRSPSVQSGLSRKRAFSYFTKANPTDLCSSFSANLFQNERQGCLTAFVFSGGPLRPGFPAIDPPLHELR